MQQSNRPLGLKPEHIVKVFALCNKPPSQRATEDIWCASSIQCISVHQCKRDWSIADGSLLYKNCLEPNSAVVTEQTLPTLAAGDGKLSISSCLDAVGL